MKFSYDWLKNLASFKESPEKLAELLTLRAFEVEALEKVGDDTALDINIPANRMTDAGNHRGMAREIATVTNSKFKIQNSKLQSKIRKFSESEKPPIQVKIAPKELCPRYTAHALEISSLGESPQWMRKRLVTCGLRPINAVVDITNYIMLETGQPLHAFDLDTIRGHTMTIRESRAGEELTTLDGTRHQLPEGVIVIEDKNRLIDLAGIMGGKNSAVGESTKQILLQAAVFEQTRIYRATKALGFSSDASKLYAAGIDHNQSLSVLEYAVSLFETYAGAKRIAAPIDINNQTRAARRIPFRPSYSNGVIGHTIPEKFSENVFKRIGCTVKKQKRDLWVVETPTNRRDLSLEEDLIEEVARVFGYEHIPPALPHASLLPAQKNDELIWEGRVRAFLSGAGYTEAYVYEFASEQELSHFDIAPAEALEIENPMSPSTRYLLPRALIKYISATAENLRHENAVQIFGIAKSFMPRDTAIHEWKDLVATSAKKGGDGKEEFYELKGIADQLIESLGISDHWYSDSVKRKTQNAKRKTDIFHPYRVAEIKVGDTTIGIIGELHPVVLERIKSKARIVAMEINFAKLSLLASAETEYRPIGKYPAIMRDIALLVPSNTKTVDVLNVIECAGGKLLADTDLFDYFEDDALRAAKQKNMAFHLIFQSPERTLTDAEVNPIIEKIIRALEQKGWEVKK